MPLKDEVPILWGLRLVFANFSCNDLGDCIHPNQRQKQRRLGGSGCSSTSHAECLMDPLVSIAARNDRPPSKASKRLSISPDVIVATEEDSL